MTSASPVTVLFANHEVEFGGSERSLLELIEGLDRDRFRPVLACPGEGPLPDAARDLGVDVRTAGLRFTGPIERLLGLRGAGHELRQIAADERAALVHANSLHAGYAAAIARAKSDVPLVWHVRDMDYPSLAHAALRLADAIVANSRATADALPSRLLRSGRVHAIHNGVAPAFFEAAPAGLRGELGLAPDALLAGTIGRISPWKGHATFLRAAARVSTTLPDAHFLIVGDVLFGGSRRDHGDLPAQLRAQAEELGIAGRTHFLGHREDVPAVLADLDLVVHPSTQPEPFGRSAAEALAAGTPLVASDIGGLPEVVHDGRTGLLTPAGDAEALAERMRRLLSDPDYARRLADAGQEDARTRFTRAHHVAEVEALYTTMLQRTA